MKIYNLRVKGFELPKERQKVMVVTSEKKFLSCEFYDSVFRIDEKPIKEVVVAWIDEREYYSAFLDFWIIGPIQQSPS